MQDQADQEVKIQRQYYAETAHKYDDLHVGEKDEHVLALSFMLGVLDFLNVRSVLDVGSGTGRTQLYFRKRKPDIKVIGIEPVKELRQVAYDKGILENELIDGDATNLKFGDGEFDLVCSFALLHHLRYPELAITEMLRVARKAIFISDSNCYGQGTWWLRTVKQALNSLGLWNAAFLIKTKGKGYNYSEGDGLSYSYSVFNNYRQIREACESIHIMNTGGGSLNPYRTAGTVALLAIKQKPIE